MRILMEADLEAEQKHGQLCLKVARGGCRADPGGEPANAIGRNTPTGQARSRCLIMPKT